MTMETAPVTAFSLIKIVRKLQHIDELLRLRPFRSPTVYHGTALGLSTECLDYLNDTDLTQLPPLMLESLHDAIYSGAASQGTDRSEGAVDTGATKKKRLGRPRRYNCSRCKDGPRGCPDCNPNHYYYYERPTSARPPAPSNDIVSLELSRQRMIITNEAQRKRGRADEMEGDPAALLRDKPRASSRYRGVYKPLSGGYNAQISHIGKTMYIGSFNSEEEAARAYDQKCLQLRARARLNFPLADYQEGGAFYGGGTSPPVHEDIREDSQPPDATDELGPLQDLASLAAAEPVTQSFYETVLRLTNDNPELQARLLKDLANLTLQNQLSVLQLLQHIRDDA